MQKTIIFLCALSLGLFTMNPLAAIYRLDSPYAEKNLRILELLPDLSSPLAVNPYIPADYIPLSRSGTLDLHEGIFWGQKDILLAYFKDRNSVELPIGLPILKLYIRPDIVQIGANSFNEEFMDSLEWGANENPGDFFLPS